MLLNLPYGAQPIIEARLRAGAKPVDMVVVSLVGPLEDGNPIVQADGPDYDWRFVRGLRVCIFGKVGTPNRQTAIAIGTCLPSWLALWDVESKEGTDVIVHIRESALDLPKEQLRKSANWTAILWPWSPWQNKQFEEAKCA